jgi:cytidylate kinase
MIVTIDGPAGAGKSSVARALADRLGFRFLDTGAMYRAVALAAWERGLDGEQLEALADLARKLTIQFQGERVFLDGRDVSQAIRDSEVTSRIRYAADNVGVREHLVRLQRELAAGEDLVTEGRDQGTLVFPNAECKIFLTASDEERARRRLEDLRRQGEETTLETVLSQQRERDRQDRSRPVGALSQAKDAIVVDTDGMTRDQVIARLEDLVRQRQRQSTSAG